MNARSVAGSAVAVQDRLKDFDAVASGERRKAF
jgi:hypothetical protein